MAQARSLDEAEFWLPSEFHTGDDFFKDKGDVPKNEAVGIIAFGGNLAFSTEFSYDFDSLVSNSTRSSPILVGSTETESGEEEDFLVGLTRQLGMAPSSLNETHKLVVPSFSNVKPERLLAGSPQSTLSGIGSWSGKSMLSNNGSPTGPSRVSSPPTSMFGARNDNLDLIYAAAGQASRIKMSSNGAIRGYHDNIGLLGSSYDSSALSLRNSNPCFFANQVLTRTLPQFQHVTLDKSFKPHSQCSALISRQINKFGLSGQHHVLQQIQNKGISTGYERGRCGYPLNLCQTSWLPLHVRHQKQQTQHIFPTNFTTRPDILGQSGVKKEYAGTGVFLPRRYNNPQEPCKKAGCPKVVIPTKVARSVNINYGDANDVGQACSDGGFSANHALLARRNAAFVHQRRILRQERAMIQDIRLPQEWTY